MLKLKHHIPRQKDKHLDKRKDTGHRCDLTSQETEVDLDSICQQDRGLNWPKLEAASTE